MCADMWVSMEMIPRDHTEVVISHTGKAENGQKMSLAGLLEVNEWKALASARGRTARLVFALVVGDP